MRHMRKYAEKLIPDSFASSAAASRRLSGIRMVVECMSPPDRNV